MPYTYGKFYEEADAEKLVSVFLRQPVGLLVIKGSGNATLVPKDRVAYKHYSGANMERLIEIWGPASIIADLRKKQCEVNIQPWVSKSAVTTTSTEASSQSSSGQPTNGTPSQGPSSNT